jgi:coenzyme F420-dependent glucose-6-phosphate dehydrogenase
MALIFYHASHEQFAPSHLLKLATAAEKAGFDGIHSSDHFHPWSKRQGQSGFAFSWIAAAMQVTNVPFSMVCAPGQRYHPAIVAQAIATISEMFPGRINIELGSGEALNEVITGEVWPEKKIRNERLVECAAIIRSLLNGEEVNFNGHVNVNGARLYTRPAILPKLLCAAISQETAKWAGGWADGLLTTADKNIQDTVKKIQGFHKSGGQSKLIYLQYAFSYAGHKKAAIDEAWHQWRSNLLPVERLATFQRVEDFDKAAEEITKEQVLDAIPVYTSMKKLMDKMDELGSLGVDRIILHNVSRMQEEFIEAFHMLR